MEANVDAAAGVSQGDQGEPSLPCRLVKAILLPFVCWAAIYYGLFVFLLIIWAFQAANVEQEISASVQLTGVKGLEPALAPGAAPPELDLLVRVHNGHIYDQYREGGGLTVFYAGVPLAHGGTPSFRVGPDAELTFTVKAEAAAVGVPEDLWRLMSADRRWGAAQLEVRMQFGWPGWESYASSIDLDAPPGTWQSLYHLRVHSD